MGLQFTATMLIFSLLSTYSLAQDSFPPELDMIGKEGEEYPYRDIPSGSDVTITCTGDKTLGWSHPTNINDVEVSADRLNGDGKHTSKIVAKDLTYKSTGLFSCYYADEPQLKTSIFFFVNDPDNLIKPLSQYPQFPHFMVMIQNQPLTIPCLVTNSNATLEFRKNHAYGALIDFGDDVLYSKTRGVTITYPNIELSNQKVCKATLNGKTSTANIILQYQSSSKPPLPEIESTKQNFFQMENITLKCSVKVDRNIGLSMRWIPPNNDDADRIVIGEATKESVQANGYNYYKVVSRLQIYNARTTDSGVYRCKVSASSANENAKDYELRVFAKSWVQLHVDYPVAEINATTKSVFFEVLYEAFPQPTFYWLKDGIPLIIEDNKYMTEVSHERARLFIALPVQSDAGEYTLLAVTNDDNDTAHFSLNFMEAPQVVINTAPTSPFYGLDRKYTVTCVREKGTPSPFISWFWQPCRNIFCDLGSSWRSYNASENAFMYRDMSRKRLQFVAKESGYVQCLATNVHGSHSSTIKVLVTDIARAQSFRFDDAALRLTEGDKLQLKCKANILAYSKPQLFKRLGDYDMLLSDDASVTTTVHSTNFTNVVMATINKTVIDDEGTYGCSFKGDNKTEIWTKSVYVKAIVAPKFAVPPNATFSVKEGDTVDLRCIATGWPEPHVIWYKGRNIVKVEPGFKLTPDNSTLTIVRIKEKDGGTYVCEASNRGGVIRTNSSLYVKAEEKEVIAKPLSAGDIGGIVAGIIVLLAVFTIVVCVLVIKMKRNRKHPASALLLPSKDQVNPDIPLDEQTDSLPYDSEWEFPRDRLKLGMILGQGAFGKVMKAQALGIEDGVASSTVAVKMVRDSYDLEQIKALISELKILIHIGQHLNIMNLLGAVTKELNKGELYVVVEYCPHGNLRSYLIKHKAHFVDTMGKPGDDPELMKRMEAEAANADDGYLNDAGLSDPHNDRNPLTTRDLVCWGFQISRGMEYLSSRKYIHRDLAARNVLLAADNVVKICDFGLAKDVYKYNEYQKKTDGPLPIKWMALESLTHKVFTTKTDVWAFGIFLWELFSLATSPYPGVELNETFIEKLKNGYRMARPQYASMEMYQLMLDCWHSEPTSRPSFEDITERTGDFIQESLVERYICLSDLYGKRNKSTSEGNGYLRMNSQGYLAMSPTDDNNGAVGKTEEVAADKTSVHSASSDESDDHYANKLTKKKREDGDEFEMKPMLKVDVENEISPQNSIKKDPVDTKDLRVDFTDGSAVTTTAMVHGPPTKALPSVSQLNPERTNNDDVFLPQPTRNGHQPLRNHHGVMRLGSNSSEASSGFMSDYLNEDAVPPNYNAAVRREPLLETDC